MTSDTTLQTNDTSPGAMMSKRLIATLVQVVVATAILFATAGTLRWTAGWIFTGLYTVIMVYMMWYLQKTDPGLMDERFDARDKPGVKKWDLSLVPLIKLFGGLAIVIVAGLEFRFGWTVGFPLWLLAAGGLLFVAGYALMIWAMAANTYFSSYVRIQEERDHSVTTGGPYRFVRHPGYAGYIACLIGTPLLLESWWGLIPVALTFVLMVVRTSLEDRMLLADLPGYTEFAQQTRFRLVPGLW